MTTKDTKEKNTLIITAPNFQTAEFVIRGTAPLVINKFSAKAKQEMIDKQMAGSQAKKGKKREAKNFDECFEQARHVSTDGWDGIPASGIRKAMIGACRLVNFKMTIAKMSVFVEADGIDADEGTPLVKIISENPPEKHIGYTRNATGVCDIRARPMWRQWGAKVRLKFDADQFSAQDVANLLARVGVQVGLCEGRPDSKESTGMGWGTFEIVQD